ncbi:hypothetical protein ASPZODRAFT_15007 [Penicilliopsis zonata CBS 506.65]|uniref:alpha-galactosidase n=1 Tax=Penicilliopsis zonata CBS 506.65 TaxID=1073090 RepID=A0A1L9SKE1_9EURO|nr:hypothetical protein ASPZODRAFT_15007 [Penicilliopsis zonata CBS 506.65]OJJ47556.1 hypothetical protein ASPZODRAFT_15007 [Penicilliopsis zonata CBS 506.65]
MASVSRIDWQTSVLTVVITLNNGAPAIASILPTTDISSVSMTFVLPEEEIVPLASIRLVGEGNQRDKTSKALVGSYISTRLRYLSHSKDSFAGFEALDILSEDPVTKLKVTTHLRVYQGVPCLRAHTTVENGGTSDLVVSQVTSLTIGALTSGTKSWWSEFTVSSATNTWFRECQWHERTLSEVGVDHTGHYELNEGHHASFSTFGHSSRGSFSTSSYLPMGMIRRKDRPEVWLWQVENNGSWRWELGDYYNDLYLAAGGPTSIDHGWQLRLLPGQTFDSVPIAVYHGFRGANAAMGTLTEYRRRIRRPHEDNERLPVIFNDYMNCLMGDPTEEKILALLEPVKRSGAEYFVIDAGWYAEDDGWWDDVGLWEPSKSRFPSGFENLLATIRDNGLIPGLWIEPEVVGMRSILAQTLPEDAFFHEQGVRVLERGRYQLNFSHPAVRERMDSVIDKLVVQYGAGYFKFDYNIEVCYGTDTNPANPTWTNPGAGHLDHQRGYLGWVAAILDRYPHLVIENCSSGGQRLDYAMLAVHPVQSTSDQQDPVLYAAIAAAIPTAVTPEQSATWAYPQPTWNDETNALTVVNSLLGRVHLSGPLNKLCETQFALVAQGIEVYKGIRAGLKTALPFWPGGLPKWHDEWISLGMKLRDSRSVYLSVWRRRGDASTRFPISVFAGRSNVTVTMLYPTTLGGSGQWNSEESSIEVYLPTSVSARLFLLELVD